MCVCVCVCVFVCVCVCVCTYIHSVCVCAYRDEALVESAIAFLGDRFHEAVRHRGVEWRLVYGSGVKV